jgi:L-methionine (R)-S-oxide reductase
MEDKKSIYEQLCAQIDSLIKGERNSVGVLANVSAALHDAFPENFFWVGFYLVKDGELQLGPFQGPVACFRIKYGRGVCGTAWVEKRTIIVMWNSFRGI